MSPNEHAEAGAEILARNWILVTTEEGRDEESGLAATIDAIFAGSEVGYKRAIITQVVGRAADPKLDAQALQKGSSDARAWDAREFAKRVFVRWNVDVGSPFSHTDDPYVSNQFRNPRFDASIRAQRKNPVLFDATLKVLEAANQRETRAELEQLLQEILRGVRRHLQGKSFSYAVPYRASLRTTVACVEAFLAQRSGGARLQALAHALFRSMSDAGLMLDELLVRHVNASDTATRSAGDVTYRFSGTRYAIEVKDRPLTEGQIRASVSKARIAEVTELIFLVEAGNRFSLFATEPDATASQAVAEAEFSSGLNLYWLSFSTLLKVVCTILGEAGRRAFLKFVGEALEEQKADTNHRWAWARIVAEA